MAEKGRNFSVYLLVLALVGAALFYGCGSSASSDAIPAIEYAITGSFNSKGLVSDSSRAAAGPSVGVLIYSESDPNNYADVDVVNKTFILKNLKPGVHNLIFKHTPFGALGTTYICRQEKAAILTDANPIQQVSTVLRAEECTVRITGKLTDEKGKPLSTGFSGSPLTLWGQKVDYNQATGEFVTPMMPADETADLIVNAINYQKTATPLKFTVYNSYQEITAVDTSINNQPPTVTLTSKKTDYLRKALVNLKAEGTDPNNDELKYIWTIESCTSPNKGTLELNEESSKKSEYYWYAPEEDCLATISVKVVEKNTLQQLSSKALFSLKIGTGEYRPNNKPVILDTTIYPESLHGSREYTITTIATDTDDETLYYYLTITPGDGTLTKNGSNTWLWKTTELAAPKEYKLDFEVKDKKNNVASTSKTVTVLESVENKAPEIISQTPSADPFDVMSGTEATLSFLAKDPENEKLTISWICTTGELKDTSFENGNAQAIWVAPYLNSPSVKEIYAIVKDPQGSSTNATFTINIVPDPEKKAPTIEIAISGTSDKYNGTIPLFKAGETVTFSGVATDSNKDVAIDPSHFTWYLIQPNGISKKLDERTSTTTFKASNQSEAGDYSIRLVATDLNNIAGEGTADFRVNTLPTVSIKCNGNTIAANGRMSTPTTQKYSNGGKDYDVFVIDSVQNFSAVCSDIETAESALDAAVSWKLGDDSHLGKNYSPTLSSNGFKTIEVTTSDSKGEKSPVTTYSFFVNSAPEFEIATTTKPAFLNNDTIAFNARVKDDSNGITMTWYISYKKGTAPFTSYVTFENPGNNPVVSSTNSLSANFQVSAATLLAATSGAQDYKFRLIATDSMGLQTVNDEIAFSIVNSHKILDFTLASGSYNPNIRPYTYDELTPIAKPADGLPYKFQANDKFSARSGSDLWQEAMTWTWYDSHWINGKQGSFATIGGEFCDDFTLNGYSIADKFGTHTIRLEGRSNEYAITASNSFDIFINSVPKIAFANTTVGETIRFDTGCNATFTIALYEDNPNEKLGLIWTIYDLNSNCEETGTAKVYESNDLDPATSDKSPVDMGGSNEKNVTINWDKISPTEPLTKGAKRVYVCAYDAYGEKATATVDILVNTLPVFNDVVGSRKISIVVPAISDNGEDYSYFREQYATASADIPVYLVAGNPSMQLDFSVKVTDAEDGTLSGSDIIWTYTDYKGASLKTTGETIKARFGIGLNTISVEARDKFYNYYSKNGVKVYNDLCVATYSADFYVWQSMSFEITTGGTQTATNISQIGSSNNFYVVYGRTNNFMEVYEINAGVNTTFQRINIRPTETSGGRVKAEILVAMPDGDGYKDIGTFTPPIITLGKKDASTFLALCKNNEMTSFTSIKAGATHVKKTMTGSEEDFYSTFLRPSALVKLANLDNAGGKTFDDFFSDDGRPGNTQTFTENVISMTYSDPNDNTAGAMLVKGWPDHPDGVVSAYSNLRYTIPTLDNAQPLYQLDNANLVLDDLSRIKYLESLADNDQKLYITDTGNNRLLRLDSDFSRANSIPASQPIDVCTTASKYLFSLAKSGTAGTDNAITLYSVDNSGAMPLTSFAKFTDVDDSNIMARAGKVKDPKAIGYYVLGSGSNYFGGLVILEKGATNKSRLQVIRSNKADWLE